MSESLKALFVGTITVATITLFVMPRRESPVPKTIQLIGQYLSRSVSNMLGVNER